MSGNGWKLFLGVILSISPGFLRAEELVLRSEDLPRLLSERNLSIRGSKQLVQAAEERTGYLARSYLPTLGAEVGAETFKTGPYSARTQPYGYLELRLNLLRGGRDLAEDTIRDLQVRLSGASAQSTFLTDLFEARKTYWTIVYYRELIGNLRDALNQSQKSLLRAERRIQRGLTTDTDRLEFEIQGDQLKEEIQSLEHEAYLNEIKLKASLGLSPDLSLKVENQIPHQHDDKFVNLKSEAGTFPDVRALQTSQGIATIERGIAARWWAPNIDLYTGYYLYTLREREYLPLYQRQDKVIGARLIFTPFDGNMGKTEAASAAIRADAMGHQEAQKRSDIEARIHISQEEMKHQHELIHLAEDRVEKGRRYLAQTLAEYDRGVKNSPDVLGAIERQTGFRRRLIEIRRDYQMAKSELMSLTP